MKCKNCKNILELDDINGLCKECQENLDMDDFASNIIFSQFNPGM